MCARKHRSSGGRDIDLGEEIRIGIVDKRPESSGTIGHRDSTQGPKNRRGLRRSAYRDQQKCE
jgi:hypothetical protein